MRCADDEGGWAKIALVLTLLFSAGCNGVGVAAAATVSMGVAAAPDLSATVANAALIARVRLVNRTVVEDGTGVKMPCGFVYKAMILEPLKGDNQTVEFFSGAMEDFRGFDRDYLVFIYDKPADTADQRFMNFALAGNGTYPGPERLACFVHSGQTKYVPTVFQNMWGFDPDAATHIGGEWLAAPLRSAPLWCYYRDRQDKTPEERQLFDQARLFPDGRFARRGQSAAFADPAPGSAVVLNWNSARLLIQRAVNGGRPGENFC